MPTNDEIIKKLEKRLHDEFLVPPLLFVQLEALVDKQARADSAKQIFKDIEKNTDLLNTLHFQTGGAISDWKQFKKKYNKEE
jgi:hypothetical protein